MRKRILFIVPTETGRWEVSVLITWEQSIADEGKILGADGDEVPTARISVRHVAPDQFENFFPAQTEKSVSGAMTAAMIEIRQHVAALKGGKP